MAAAAEVETPQSGNFIWIHYGENRKILANLNCNATNFLHYLKTKCEYEPNIHVGLCDENGHVVNLAASDPNKTLVDSVESRLTYVLVSLEKDDRDAIKDVKPLLLNANELYPNLAENLNQIYHEKDDSKAKKRDGTKQAGRGGNKADPKAATGRKSKK